MYIKPTYTVHRSKPQLNEVQMQQVKERNFSATLKMK